MNETETKVAEALAALATEAPSGLLPGVLYGVGLRDHYALVEGPLEPVYVAWNANGITACVPQSVATDDFGDQHPRPADAVETPPAALAEPLTEALATGRMGRLPVDLSALGSFQRKVLEKCAEIPPGEIRPYGWIAREIGNPGSVRAVGTALGRNPVPILIPCHRVVRSDGHIGNYAYGTEMKRSLLVGEGLDPDSIESDADHGLRFVGSDTTGIYCYPTCRNAKRITDQHRVSIRSAADAAEAGFRACKVCRPAA